MTHSIYTSVPLAKFLGSRFDPNDNVTIGASVIRSKNKQMNLEWSDNKQEYHQNLRLISKVLVSFIDIDGAFCSLVVTEQAMTLPLSSGVGR